MVKIMIVDDSKFMRMFVVNILKRNKYLDIIEAGDGEEAITKFKRENPDLVLLDIIMPDITGVDVLKEIKKLNPNAKVIMVTAVGQEIILKECKQLGAEGQIIKPFTEENIIATIKKVLGGGGRRAK